MSRRFVWGAIAAFVFSFGISSVTYADLYNGGFETGSAEGNPDNAPPWDWTPNGNGERVQVLDDGAPIPSSVILPAFGSWFGYAENGAGSQLSGEVAQVVHIPNSTPSISFWWRFFTNETPNTGFNDRFRVSVEGSTTVSAVIATVDGTTMIGGTLATPAGSPGQGQTYSLYTASWVQYTLNLSALAGENVTVYFRVTDTGAHNQSSGFALDNVEITPEPASAVLLALGSLLVLRRRPA